MKKDNPIKINLHNNNHVIEYSEFVDSITYITLEYSVESLIGKVTDLCFKNGTFFIFDKSTESILIFDATGKYKNKISHAGKGPGEYIGIVSFAVNSADSSINILDARNKIIKYSTSGNYISEIKINDIIRDFVYLANGKYLFYTPDYNLQSRRGAWVASSEGKFEKQLLEVDDKVKFSPLVPFYLCELDNNKIGVPGIEDDNIYHFSNDSLEVAFNLILDQKIPDKILKKESTDILKNSDKEINIKALYIETQKWVLVSFISFNNNSGNDNTLFVYSKKDEKYVLGKKLNNNIDYILGRPTRAVDGNSIITVVSQELFYKSNSEIFDKNPVLQILHLK